MAFDGEGGWRIFLATNREDLDPTKNRTTKTYSALLRALFEVIDPEA
jgi:hypothetical protein